MDIPGSTVPDTGLPPPVECCLSAIVTAELRTGLAKQPADAVRERKLEAFIALFQIRDFDDAAARHYGDIRADLERRTEVGQEVGVAGKVRVRLDHSRDVVSNNPESRHNGEIASPTNCDTASLTLEISESTP